MAGVRLWLHAGPPPPWQDVADLLDLPGDGNYLYFLATTAQERARRDDVERLGPLPRAQVVKDEAHPSRDAVALFFPDAIGTLLDARGATPLRRLDERILVGRALEAVANGDEDLKHQLAHDARAWNEALREAASRGIDLSALEPGRWPPAEDPGTLHRLCELQKEFPRELARAAELPPHRITGGETLLEAAMRQLVEEGSPVPHVLLEGFSRPTPLQRRLIESWSQTATVDILVPYRANQAHGFDAISSAYDPWWPDRETWPEPEVDAVATRLAALQRTLFSNGTERHDVASDGTVDVVEFGRRHQEVARCLTEIDRVLEEEEIEHEDIALVALDLAGYRSLIAEEARRQGLPVTVNLPPTQLLLTPVGRFVLTLYEVWESDAGTLQMTGEQFEDVVASGWLGADAQATSSRLRAARAQIFATIDDDVPWVNRLRYLERLLDGRTHFPETARIGGREAALAVQPDDLGIWAGAVANIERLCGHLFEEGERPIGEHVERLRKALGDLPTADVRETELAVIEQLQNALGAAERAGAIGIDASEFSSVLSGLAREREEDEQEAEGPPPSKDTIWITTLRGIDGVSRKRVFVLGVDDKRMPMPYRPPWPFADDDVAEHIDFERYLFLATVRAASERLVLSYSRADSSGPRLPSMYLDEVAAITGAQDSQHDADQDAASARDPLEPPAPPRPIRVERPQYSLAEAAHFGECPYRYKTERLAPEHRVYRTDFQLRLFAEAVWLDMVFTALEKDSVFADDKARLLRQVDEYVEKTKAPLRHRFPGLTDASVGTLHRYVAAAALNAIWFGVWEQARFRPDDASIGFDIEVDGEARRIVDAGSHHKVQIVRSPYRIWADRFHREWLIPASDEDRSIPEDAALPAVFPTRKEAFGWYGFAQRTVAYKTADHPEHAAMLDTAATLVRALEEGAYPRIPGAQCSFCPCQPVCLGVRDPRQLLWEEDGLVFEEHRGRTPQWRDDLGEEQQAVVDRVASRQFTVVSAGAGSGKTHTMVASLLRLLEDGATVDQFALVTFTRKAAEELRSRIDGALRQRQQHAETPEQRARWFAERERLAGALIGTIHSFCRRVLESHGHEAGVPRSAAVIVSRRPMQECLEASIEIAIAGRTDADEAAGPAASSLISDFACDEYLLRAHALDIIDYCRRVGVSLDDLRTHTEAQPRDGGWPYRAVLAEVIQRTHANYGARKRRDGLVDTDDLLHEAQALLRSERGPEVARSFAERHPFLFVDEFQDTDPIQADIVEALAEHLEAVLVVGDLKQSIYGFRAAQPSLLETFAERHHREGPLPLNVAHRPTLQFLHLQNAFFQALGAAGYPELADPLVAEEEPFEPKDPLTPLLVRPATESADIARCIEDLLGQNIETRDGSRKVEPGDIAILCRGNKAVRGYQREVTAELPGNLRVFDDSGGLFFQRHEVISTYRMLRLIAEPGDDAVLSTALETSYLDPAHDKSEDVRAAEAQILMEGGRPGALTAWFEKRYPGLAAHIDALRETSRRSDAGEVLVALFELFEIRHYYEELGHRRAVENLEKLREHVRTLFGNDQALTLRIYVDHLTRAIGGRWDEPDATDVAGSTSRPPYVRVMTIHRAKGLEFPIVIIPNMGRRLLHPAHDPYFIVGKAANASDRSLDMCLPLLDSDVDTRTADFQDEVEAAKERRVAEEMRLLYVAFTRAQHAVVCLGGGTHVNSATNEWYSWKDEVRRAREVLVPLGARYLDA